VWNRRRVVYYTILLLLILGELLGERNYIIIIFPEYDSKFILAINGQLRIGKFLENMPINGPEASK